MAPAYFRNMSGLLLAFVVLSALAHGISLMFSSEPVVQLSERRFGATIISTVLTPAKDKPAAPTAQQKNPLSGSPQLEQAAKSAKQAQANNISTVKKSELLTTANTNSDTESSEAQNTSQIKSQIKPQAEPTIAAMASENAKAIPTTESLANQLKKQRNYLLGELQNRLNRYLVYPLRARKRGWQGEVMVAFNINNHGQLNNVRLAKSSGYLLLDRSAVTAISKLNKITLPNILGELQAMDLQLPVRYELREG